MPRGADPSFYKPKPKRQIRRTAETKATHLLTLSCRRLTTAITSSDYDPYGAEAARRDAVKHMADLLEEFGLLTAAKIARSRMHEFDGRDIEEPNAD